MSHLKNCYTYSLQTFTNDVINGYIRSYVFSNCSFKDILISEVVIEHCYFINCFFENLKVSSSVLRFINFRNCKIKNGYYDNNIFKTCFINKNSMDGSLFIGTNVIDTNFSNSSLAQCLFKNCIIIITNLLILI